MEGDANANTAEGGTRGVKEGGGGTSGSLVVITQALTKGAVMVDIGATFGPAKVVGTLTSTAGATS